MSTVVTVILGGGQGARLRPLTEVRSKPAVPVAGKFRLIDIPISNSIRAGINRIYILTQFNSESLHRHIAQTYRFDAFSNGFVNLLAAAQGMGNRDWYQGTADAVRQSLHHVVNADPSEIVILSGDQLYLMDLADMVRAHRERDSDLTIAVTPVSRDEAGGLGVMHIDDRQRIVDFAEKPQEAAVLDHFTLDEATAEGVDADPGSLLASMGIYVFSPEALTRLLSDYPGDDFGRELIPAAIDDFTVCAYSHNGYWRDIGTIGAFHEASLELTHQLPALNLYDPAFPIYTHPRFLPASKIIDCEIHESILSEGSILGGSVIRSSIVGVRAVIRAGSTIERSVVMGNNRYESDPTDGSIPVGIGHDCVIRDAIVDMDVRIGDGCRLVNERGVEHDDGRGWSIRDGVIVIHKGSVIPAGTTI